MASGKINNKNRLSGSISSGNNLNASVTAGSGTTDHNRLTNRALENQHPIEAISGLREELDSKLDSKTALPLIKEAVDGKAKGLYYDAKKELNKKSYWYLTSEIDPKTGQGTKESVISGPYNLGAGGGGGGGTGITTISIQKDNWPAAAVVGGKTILKINWVSVVGENKEPTGPGTFYLTINGKQVEIIPGVEQGAVEFDISKYIIAGANSIQVKCIDSYGTSSLIVGTINGVTLELKSTFNANLNYTNFINYTYVPYGDVEKTVYFIIDGKEHGTQVVKSTGESQTYKITGLTHGSHTLEVYFTATISGVTVTSNSLFYDLIYYTPKNTTPIIASTFKDFEQEQYIAFNIPYRVFIDERNEFEVSFLVNDEEINRTTVGTSEQYWNYINNTPGNYKLTIKCGNVTKDFNVYIKPTTINVTPVEQDLVLALNTQGRNNNENSELRATWKDEKNNISCTLTGFNWKSNGWVADADGNTVLRVSGGAKVTIPYKAFTEDFKNYGKTIELEIATSAVRNYSTTLISCLDKQSTDFYETSTSFAEEDFRRYTFKVNLDTTKIKDSEGKSKLTSGTHVFSYTTNGWYLDSEVKVDLADYGISISQYEINPEGTHPEEFLLVGDNIIINYTLAARGFYVTPQIAGFRSQQSFISTQYKEDEHVRISFVVEKNTENRIIWMYINGIASGAMQYPVDDNFRQLDANIIEIGSSDAVLDIYNIRIYDNSLTSKQIVNNWIADTQDVALKAARYTRNDNYNDKNEIVMSKLPSDLPYIVWDIQPLPEFKGDKRLGNAVYVDPTDSSRNFTSERAQYNVQGTSSSVYPTKNIRIKFKAKDDDPNFFWINDNGDTIKKFPITYPGGIGDNYFTFKVDYASSEGANNVELTKLYNDTCIEMGILTPPQRKDLKVRVGIDGFPIAAFYRDEEGKDSFLTKANFNNDKANEDVYGFADGDESWETTNNSADETKYKIPAGEDNFENGFEIRFPDSDDWNGDVTKLKAMTTWVASTNRELATGEPLAEAVTYTYDETVIGEDNSETTKEVTKTFTHDTAEYRLIKFRAELPEWFNVNSTLFYYVFTHLFLMIDSRAKNAFPTYFKSRQAGDGGDRWFWIPYDMDTAIGIDNKGKLSFDYNLEDTDQLDGADVFNGQDSVMWCNLRDSMLGEIKAMYAKMRLTGLISYDEVEKRFEAHQGKWSENIFNEDAKNKYIVPLAKGDNYLEMLQGSKAQQRKWWLYNRFKYMDSKYNAGDAIKDFIQFRAYVDSGVDKPYITITPYADIYATVSYANGRVVAKRAKRNEQIIIENPFDTSEKENDQETYIYSASQLKSIGDISRFRPDTVKIGNAIKLQELKVGDKSPDYKNPYLKELTVGGNILLKSIDARNCVNLGTGVTSAPDLSQCINIEEIYFTGTKIKGIVLPDGGNITTLHLPGTLTSLTIKNQPLLKDLNIEGTNTTLNIPTTNPDAYTLVGTVVSKSDWTDSAEVTLVDNESEIAVVISDKEIYDAIQLNETSLVVNCNDIEVRYDLIDGETVSLVNCRVTETTLVALNSDNLVLTVKPAIDYAISNSIAPTKEDYGTSLIESLWLENIPSESIKSEAMVGKMKPNTAVRLIGINETYNTYEEIKHFYDILDTKKGLTADGNTVDKAQVTGTININTILYKDKCELESRYPEIKINATTVVCIVTFKATDIDLPMIQNVAQGTTASEPVIPVKEPTQQHYYIFDKWVYNNGTKWNSTDIITEDIVLTAVFIEKVQEYTVQFNTNSDIITVDPTELTLYYGSLVTEPQLSNIPEGVTLEGWFRDNGQMWDFTKDLLTKHTLLIAKWIDGNAPVVHTKVKDATHFTYEASDNLGITEYAITVGDKEPIWNSIVSTTSFKGEITVEEPGLHTFWIKDSAGNIANSSLQVYAINSASTEGIINYSIYEGDYIEDTFEKLSVALVGTEIRVKLILDSHYNNLEITANDRYITEDTTITVESDININLTCTPRIYTVTFSTVGKGVDIPFQEIVYNNKVTQPLSQYWGETMECIGGWYLTLHDGMYSNPWNFETDVVTEDIVLFAKWEPYHEPSIITVIIPEDAPTNENGAYEVTLNYSNGNITTEDATIKIDFGDGQEYSSLGIGLKQLTHEYTTTGIKTIKVQGNNKGYTLGYNADNPIITPIEYLTDINLAWDLAAITTGAFKGAINLNKLPLTEYISTLGNSAFENCTGITSISLPKNLVFIGDRVFYGCSEIAGTLHIPEKIISIGNNAFTNCTKIENITFGGEYLTTIGDRAFANCNKLQSISLPLSVNKLGDGCFAACSSLSKVVLTNSELEVGDICFNECPSLVTAGPIGSFDSEGRKVNLEYAWLTKLPNYAFSAGGNQSYLKEIILPLQLEEIGNSAFLNTKIKQITLPYGLKTIGTNAFTYSSISKLVIPETTTWIKPKAFTYCRSLTSVEIYAVTTEQEIVIADDAWFAKSNPGLEIQVSPAIFDETVPIIPSDVFGPYWNFYGAEKDSETGEIIEKFLAYKAMNI